MGEVLRQWAPAVLAWALVLTRDSGEGARRCVRWVLLGLACSLTTQVPVVYAALGRLSGESHAARLVSHAGMLFTAWAAQEFMARVNGLPRGSRWHARWIAAAFALMCVLFAALPDLLPQSPWVMEYSLTYVAGQVPAFAAVILLGLRYARRAQDRVLRVSLRLVVAGTALGLLYLLDKSVLAMAPRLGFEFPFGRTALPGKVLPTTAYVLVLVGAALPAARDWLDRYRLHLGLGPLWRALYRADPAIALDPPTVPDVLVLRHLRLRLYRRVIEIRDGLLALQPYRTPDATTSAHARAAAAGLTGRALEAAVEAEAVAAALRARAVGAPPTSEPVPVNGGADLVEDTLFLRQVSAAYRATTGDRPAPRPLPGLGAADHIR
ncbi:MAB_1171c family putative transporter [Actinosynnema sp. CA-299493]